MSGLLHGWRDRVVLVLKWIAFMLVVTLGFAAADYYLDKAPSDAPMGERVTTDEEFLTAGIIRSAIETSINERSQLIQESREPGFKTPSSKETAPGYSPEQYHRDAHAKGHGCVKATFTINQNIETRYAYGVLANAGHEYQAFIRYSNGNPKVQSDALGDPHGMAVKLFGVDGGKKLLSYEEDDKTQDFIMMDNPIFFIRTIEQYAEFNQLLGSGHVFKYFFNGPDMLKWHLRQFKLALGAAHSRPESLMTTRYFSASAYALGPQQYVKYSAIPCRGNAPAQMNAKEHDSPDYLRLELAKQSEKGGACFDFAVQAQVLGKYMPVEDTTVEWKESDSPFVPVAKITITPLKNNTEEMNNQCENTAFNPWHSLEDHRPVGVMNRVRKALYQAMSRFRQIKNCAENCDRTCNSQKLPDNACLAVESERPPQ